MARKTFKTKVKVGGERVDVEVSMPRLVGVTEAAALLGVPKSNISRLKTQGRMPSPVPVDGPSADVWLRSEVEKLAREMKKSRAARAKT